MKERFGFLKLTALMVGTAGLFGCPQNQPLPPSVTSCLAAYKNSQKTLNDLATCTDCLKTAAEALGVNVDATTRREACKSGDKRVLPKTVASAVATKTVAYASANPETAAMLASTLGVDGLTRLMDEYATDINDVPVEAMIAALPTNVQEALASSTETVLEQPESAPAPIETATTTTVAPTRSSLTVAAF